MDGPTITNIIPAPPASVRFTLSPAAAAALAQHRLLDVPATPPRAKNLVEDWFDTPGLALLRHGYALSLVKARRGFLQSLCQGEVRATAPIPGPTPDLAAIPPEQAEPLAALLQDETLAPVLTTRIKRLTRQAGAVELRFETGFILTAHGKQPVCELELRGPGQELYRLAMALQDEHELLLQPTSLLQRGIWAVGAARPGAVKAGPGLAGAICLDDAVAALTQSCLTQFSANWPAFYSGAAVESVHQMRVAMRRLRSVLGLFNRAFAAPEFRAFRDEAKRIATIMGEARNWDVFSALLREGPVQAFPHEPGFAALLDQCAANRASGYEQVRALLADPATTRFLLTLEFFLARHGWRNGLEAEALTGLTAPVQNFAVSNLERLHRKVRKRGKHLVQLGAHERHLTRIELKKLRYAADLFGGLFEARGRVRAYNRATAELQEELGLLNDLATAHELLGRLDGTTPDRARAIGIVLGWCAHAANANDKQLAKSWRDFTGAKLFTG
jgi:triphosphatase